MSRVRSMRACGPSTGPTACALAGRRCSLWGRQKGVPGGGAFHRCEGRLVSGAVPPPAARPPERAARVPRPVCPGCGRCRRVDPAPAPQRAPLRAGVARCGGGGRASPGGVPSTVARGAWCQALPLPRPLVLRSVQPGFRDPCVPGAVDAGVWTQHRPHSVRPYGPALLAVGVAEGRPRGELPSTVVRGAWCQALSLPWPLVLRSVQPGFRDPCVPGAVDAGVWTQHRPHSVRPCGPALLAVGVAEGRPRGGLSSTVVRGAWCQALSLPRQPVLRSVQPGFRDPRVPGAVGVGVGARHRPHSVRPCGPALLAVGVAEGRPRGGAFHHGEGRLGSGAVPLPSARPLPGGLPGFVGCVRCVWCLCRACRGAWCCSFLGPPVLPSPVSRCGVVLAVCPPCPLLCVRPLLVRWLPLVPFAASLLFTLSSTPLPGMHFFPASALLRVSVFFLVGPEC